MVYLQLQVQVSAGAGLVRVGLVEGWRLPLHRLARGWGIPGPPGTGTGWTGGGLKAVAAIAAPWWWSRRETTMNSKQWDYELIFRYGSKPWTAKLFRVHHLFWSQKVIKKKKQHEFRAMGLLTHFFIMDRNSELPKCSEYIICFGARRALTLYQVCKLEALLAWSTQCVCCMCDKSHHGSPVCSNGWLKLTKS